MLNKPELSYTHSTSSASMWLYSNSSEFDTSEGSKNRRIVFSSSMVKLSTRSFGDETNAFGIQMGDQLSGNLRVKVNTLIF